MILITRWDYRTTLGCSRASVNTDAHIWSTEAHAIEIGRAMPKRPVVSTPRRCSPPLLAIRLKLFFCTAFWVVSPEAVGRMRFMYSRRLISLSLKVCHVRLVLTIFPTWKTPDRKIRLSVPKAPEERCVRRLVSGCRHATCAFCSTESLSKSEPLSVVTAR